MRSTLLRWTGGTGRSRELARPYWPRSRIAARGATGEVQSLPVCSSQFRLQM